MVPAVIAENEIPNSRLILLNTHPRTTALSESKSEIQNVIVNIDNKFKYNNNRFVSSNYDLANKDIVTKNITTQIDYGPTAPRA